MTSSVDLNENNNIVILNTFYVPFKFLEFIRKSCWCIYCNTMFSDDFSGNRSYLIRLNSLYIKGGIQKRWVARMNVNKQTANTRKFIKKLIKKYN